MLGSGASVGKSSASRVIRLKSECPDSDSLVVEEFGVKNPVSVSTTYDGVIIGCTRMSWAAWNFIKSEVEKGRP